mmetsp:Transcript_25546/g.35237  ORF Transcript_25546/g.35237 Transcript_25546/m.35237 type:complete len:338 (-) Transcript_25546:138-1151(-)
MSNPEKEKFKDIPSLLPLAPGGVYSVKWEERAKWVNQIEVDPVEYTPPYPINPENPTCFLELRSGGYFLGRIVIELKMDVCPITSENFLKLCEYKCYTGSMMKVWPGVKILGGDFSVRDPLVWASDDPECFDFDTLLPDCAEGGQAVFGPEPFPDENFQLAHSGAGVLTMAPMEGKRDSNGSQFMFTLMGQEDLDGNNVAFGQVVEGFEFLNTLSKVGKPHQDGTTYQRVTVEGCGLLSPGKQGGVKTEACHLETAPSTSSMKQKHLHKWSLSVYEKASINSHTVSKTFGAARLQITRRLNYTQAPAARTQNVLHVSKPLARQIVFRQCFSTQLHFL